MNGLHSVPDERYAATASPAKVTLKLVLVVFCVELVIMKFLPLLAERVRVEGAVLDAILLTIFIVPAILLIVFRPLTIQISNRLAAQQALRKSEEIFSKAFHANPAVMAISTLEDLRYLDVNRAFERFTGYSRSETLGRTAKDLELWDSPESLELFRHNLLSKEPVNDVEVVFRRATAESVIGRLSAEIVEFEDTPCLLTVTVDVTERKRLEREIIEANGRAKHLEGIQQTAVTLQHEINNPLTGVMGYAQLIEMKLPAIAVEPTPLAIADLRSSVQQISLLATQIAGAVEKLRNLYDPVLAFHPISLDMSAEMINLHESKERSIPKV